MKWLAASVSLIFLAGFVGAHAGDHSELPEPGTTPGSPFFGLEKAQESVSIALTFNPEKKAHKRMHIAQERLSEAQKLSEDNESSNAEKAVQMHARAMERASQAVQNLPENKRVNVSQELDSTRNQSVSVLQDLKQRLPESAMNGINTAIEAHRERGAEAASEGPGPDKRPDQNNTRPSNTTQQPSRPDVSGDEDTPRSGGYRATSSVVRDS